MIALLPLAGIGAAVLWLHERGKAPQVVAPIPPEESTQSIAKQQRQALMTAQAIQFNNPSAVAQTETQAKKDVEFAQAEATRAAVFASFLSGHA